jgi:tRNA wybutosine-synthesizing protein 4
LGYFEDPFIKFMGKGKPKKMFPIINRGTWSRVHAYRRVIEQFLSSPGEKQILSFGAGLDTTFFYLRAKHPTVALHYFEVDFPEVVLKKQTIIAKTPVLAKLAEDGNAYSLLACDLRDLPNLETALTNAHATKATPTLILTECVLVYMESTASQALANWCAGFFDNVALFNYEMCNPADPFGQVMVSNIEARLAPEPA